MPHTDRRSIWSSYPNWARQPCCVPGCVLLWWTVLVPVLSWSVTFHRADMSAKSVWRKAWFLLRELGYFCGLVFLYSVSWIVFRRSSSERRGNRNYKKFFLTFAPLLCWMCLLGFLAVVYIYVLFSQAPLEALGGFSAVVIPALLHCSIPLSAMTAASSW